MTYETTIGGLMLYTVILSALVSGTTISQNKPFRVLADASYESEVKRPHALWKMYTDRQREFQDGENIRLLLSSTPSVHNAFCEEALGMTAYQFRNFWLKKRFTEPVLLPRRSPSDAITANKVSEGQGWIGVVASNGGNSRIRHLRIKRFETRQ